MPAQTLIKTTLPSGKHQCPRRQPHTATYDAHTHPTECYVQPNRYTDTRYTRLLMKCMNTLTRWNRNLYGSVSVRHWGFPHCVRAHNHFDGHVKFKLKSLERWQTRTHLPKARKNTSEKQDETEWQTNKMLELPRKTMGRPTSTVAQIGCYPDSCANFGPRLIIFILIVFGRNVAAHYRHRRKSIHTPYLLIHAILKCFFHDFPH